MRGSWASSTAQYVAAVRALLSADAVLDDRCARPMLGPTMRCAVTVFRWPVLRRWTRSPFFAALAARIAWFDAESRRALEGGVTQIVVLGAGYDSRSWRLARDGVRWFEVDHPATQADKRRRAPGGGPIYVPFDLLDAGLDEALRTAGFDGDRPALFLLEGVVMYFAEPDVRALLGRIAALASPGSRLAVNFGAPPGTGGRVERIRQALLRQLGRARGEPHRSFARASAAAAIVAASGWHVDRVVPLREEAPVLLPHADLPFHRINPVAAAVAASR